MIAAPARVNDETEYDALDDVGRMVVYATPATRSSERERPSGESSARASRATDAKVANAAAVNATDTRTARALDRLLIPKSVTEKRGMRATLEQLETLGAVLL